MHQTYKANDGGYVRDAGCATHATKALVENMSDRISGTSVGGHDYRKVCAAYRAVDHKDSRR